MRAREGYVRGEEEKKEEREKEGISLFVKGKGKGLGKTPKQIRVPPLTDRKFVEVRPREKPRGRRRTIGCLIGRSGTRPIVPRFRAEEEKGEGNDIYDRAPCVCQRIGRSRIPMIKLIFFSGFVDGSICGLMLRHRPIIRVPDAQFANARIVQAGNIAINIQRGRTLIYLFRRLSMRSRR